jgi:hypothetical protein
MEITDTINSGINSFFRKPRLRVDICILVRRMARGEFKGVTDIQSIPRVRYQVAQRNARALLVKVRLLPFQER